MATPDVFPTDTSHLEPPRKKRRLTHVLVLDLYDSPDPSLVDPSHEKHNRSADESLSLDDETLDEPLKIPSVLTSAYDDYLETLPLNIMFKARIPSNKATQAAYPNATLGEWVRLYYPDYKSFRRLLAEGIEEKLGIDPKEVRTVRLVASKAGEVVYELDFLFEAEVWERAMRELRKKGIGKNSDGGIRMASSVKLYLGVGSCGQ
jgi:hypothetical protein